MRVNVLLMALATLLASSGAVQESTETQLSRMLAIPTIDQKQAASARSRFLREHKATAEENEVDNESEESDGSEERTGVDKYVVNSVFHIARGESAAKRRKINLPGEIVPQIKRSGFPVSAKVDVDDLLNPIRLDGVLAKEDDMEAALMRLWGFASPDVRKAAIQKILNDQELAKYLPLFEALKQSTR
uniref:RxLR effector protein n=1 Tax=Phytophthora sojae TaxID=67593 RepID=G1FR49_PHYSO|nr:Avh62 [Phytophthora sojae]